MFYYRAYQLNVQSDILLGKIIQVPPCTPDVIICETTEIPAIPASAKRLGNMYASLENQFWITDTQWSFHIEGGNKIIYKIESKDLNTPINILLSGVCFACLLIQRDLIVLHANTLSYDSHSAIAFCGYSGAGKSTATAYHLKKGALLVADDITAIEFKGGKPYVLSGFSRLKLWNDSKDLLNFSSLETIYSFNGRSKHHIALHPNQYINEPIKLEKLMIIQSDIIKEQEIKGQNKVKTLLENNYTAPIFTLFNSYLNQLKGNLYLSSQLSIFNTPRPFVS